jgi:hypothetical protein
VAKLVAFNRVDADALLDLLEGAGGQSIARSTSLRRRGVRWGRTAVAVPANSAGNAQVYLQDPTATGWSDGALLTDVWTRGSAIAINKQVILITIDGRWCAFEVC